MTSVSLGVLVVTLCFGPAAVGANTVSPSANLAESRGGQPAVIPHTIETEKKKTDPDSYVVECASEKIIMKRGGTDVKIEVDQGSQVSYTIRDNRDIPMDERYYRYNKWDIVFARSKKLSQTAIFSSTVTLTIPEKQNEQELYLITSSGNIQIENLDDVNLFIESENGSISVKNTNAAYISAKSVNGNIQLTNTTSRGDIVTHSDYGTVSIQLGDSNIRYSVKVNTEPNAGITINKKKYSGGKRTLGLAGKQTITLDGENNTFNLLNVHLFDSAKK